jgi:hypothetical protein
MQLPVYNISIDECDAENGEYLGVLEIANTANPAIMIKGIALSEIKQMIFKDDLLYRIASPVLIPSKIYRRDAETGEEYYVNVTSEVVEKMFMKFQKDRSGQDIFNDEHDEAKRVPSYILETWLVETPKTDKSFITYGIECPEKTWFAVQQFTDKQAYFECVESGKIGFSIHGESALKFTKQEIIKQINMSKKRKFVAQFTEAVGTDSGEVIVTADVLEVGADVAVLDTEFTPIENFTGEITIEDTPVVITDNVITSMGAEEMEMKTDEVVVEEVEMAKEEEVVVETEMAVEMPTDVAVEAYTKAEMDAKFDEIYAMIAELKTGTATEMAVEEVEMAEAPKSGIELKMSKVEKLSNFINKK